MVNKERSFIYAIVFYIGLCLYAYYYKKFEMPLSLELDDDVEIRIRAITYPLSFVFNFILALLFYLTLKLLNHIQNHFK
jgi:hypothetical protein